MESQRALISQILQDNAVYHSLNPQEWWFTDGKCKIIFRAIEQIISSGNTADSMAVGMKVLPSEVASLSALVPSTANAKYYADRCKEAGRRHQLEHLSSVITDATRGGETPEEIAEKINEVMERIFISGGEFQIRRASERMIPLVEKFEERHKNRGQIPGLQTGFGKLDAMMNGFQDSMLYVIGARPSQGKSALMLNMATVISRQVPVGIISLESSMEEVLTREVALISRIDSQKLVSGYFAAADFSRLFDATQQIAEKEMYLYDKPNCTIAQISLICKLMRQRHNVKCIFIDYLQLIRAPGTEGDRERVLAASNALKDISRELGIPIIALAQLRRDSDGRRPTLGDFQHSSQIEQDADVGLLIWHRIVDMRNKTLPKTKVENEAEERLQIYLIVDKNRDGKTGYVPVDFEPEYLTFREVV